MGHVPQNEMLEALAALCVLALIDFALELGDNYKVSYYMSVLLIASVSSVVFQTKLPKCMGQHG